MTVTMMWERGPVSRYLLHLFDLNLPQPPKPGQEVAPRQNGAGSSTAYSAQPAASPSDNLSHLPTLHRSIMEFMQRQEIPKEGIHVSAISRAVGGDAVTIRYVIMQRHRPYLTRPFSDALDKLTDDGLVYSGTDESHFLIVQ